MCTEMCTEVCANDCANPKDSFYDLEANCQFCLMEETNCTNECVLPNMNWTQELEMNCRLCLERTQENGIERNRIS